MTTVEILFRYSGQPSEPEIFALANARDGGAEVTVRLQRAFT